MKTERMLLVTLSAMMFALAAAAAPTDPLEAGFLSPPYSAKPHTWWHWMNGNITNAGIAADLEAMKQIGLGGATIVNVDCGIPRGPVTFMSPQWQDDFKFAVQEANRLGLKLCVENCPGWSSSGDPWITPTNAMQRVTISEVHVTGPMNFNAVLPQPPTTLDFYRDIAVLAFPEPADEEVRMSDFAPVASVSGGQSPGNKLTDGNDRTFIRLPVPKHGEPQFVQLKFPKPFSARTVKIAGGPGLPLCRGDIQISDDGRTFRAVHSFAFRRKGGLVLTISLGPEPVVARYWRLQFTRVTGNAGNIPLAEFELSPRLTIENLQAKAGFSGVAIPSSPGPDTAVPGVIQRRHIIDLASRLGADGKLCWRVPAGRWVILRVGYTPTGMKNHPAPAGGQGLECDKLSRAGLNASWAGFMQKVLDDVGPLAGQTLNASLIDSYEVGGQNWTKNFRAEFKKLRGYDPLKFLPEFAGYVVDNPQVSERFLWDVRRTIADLFAKNYYGYFAELCHEHGLRSHVEPYTGPFEPLQCGAPVDVVMGEFWAGSRGNPSVKLATSVAHIYGKTIVGAESFTGNSEHGGWEDYPYSLKELGDLMFCRGVNRYIFHRYAMQPWTNRWPGMTMGPYGINFERTETWWNQGKPWIKYITRCEFLLQQGRAVEDAAYFDGQSAPVKRRDGHPPLPVGYDFDDVDAGVLMHGATVKHGRLTLAGGANYAVLVLPPDDINMTPQMMKCLRKLVRAGATVVGPRPQHSPSLENYPECDAQVKKIAGELWGNCNGKTVLEHRYGKGRVIWGESLTDVFAEQNLKPDFEFHGASRTTHLAYTHRIDGNGDIYFVSNQRRQFDSAECTFRVNGKVPELWHPDTGVIEPAPIWSEHDGRTTVRLNFQPAGSMFVIFRGAANGADHLVAAGDSFAAKPVAWPKLKILRADYTAVDGAGGMEVTAKLSQLARGGQLMVKASNGTFGHDPAPNHKKELRVDYAFNGKTGHISVPEGDTLRLPPKPPMGEAPPWSVSLAADGSPVVKFWENGSVRLHAADGKVLSADATDVPAPRSISGPWDLSFPPDWGAPPSDTLDKLISWTDDTNVGVRYFSGTATYEREIDIPADRLAAGHELWLDLGVVKDFAEVSLNGHDFGVLWKPPFRVNITAAAKPGANKLVVKVTNLWPNRLIGDEHLPPDCEWNGDRLKQWPRWLLQGKPSPTGRFTFTTWRHYTKDSPLLESGLLGPVMLRTREIVPAG